MTDEDAFWSVCKGEILVSNSGKKIGIQVDVGVFKTHFLMSPDLAQLSVSTSNRSASRKGFLKTYTIRYHKMPKYITVFC